MKMLFATLLGFSFANVAHAYVGQSKLDAGIRKMLSAQVNCQGGYFRPGTVLIRHNVAYVDGKAYRWMAIPDDSGAFTLALKTNTPGEERWFQACSL